MNKLKFLPDGIIVEEGRPDHPLSLTWLLCHHNHLLDRVKELEASASEDEETEAWQVTCADLREKLRVAEAVRDAWRAKYSEMRESKQALNDSKQKEIGRLIQECNAHRLDVRNAEAEADKWRAEAQDLREKLENGLNGNDYTFWKATANDAVSALKASRAEAEDLREKLEIATSACAHNAKIIDSLFAQRNEARDERDSLRSAITAHRDELNKNVAHIHRMNARIAELEADQ